MFEMQQMKKEIKMNDYNSFSFTSIEMEKNI